MITTLFFIASVLIASANDKPKKSCPDLLLKSLTKEAFFKDSEEFDYDSIVIEEPVEAEQPKPMAKIKLKKIRSKNDQ